MEGLLRVKDATNEEAGACSSLPVSNVLYPFSSNAADLPKQNSKFASILPNIAARITATFLFPPAINTINKIISTILPNVVSKITPATFGIFLASSCPANPTRFAAGTIPR